MRSILRPTPTPKINNNSDSFAKSPFASFVVKREEKKVKIQCRKKEKTERKRKTQGDLL